MEVKSVNKNKLGKIIKNGVALVVLAGGLTIVNPVKSNGGYDIVNAAVDLSETKEDAINELKTVYKKYLKKYYTSKSYTKLTKYYKKGVELIKDATTVNKIDAACEKYKELMEGIKPYYLVKYQNKMTTKVENSYKKLVSKNSYSDSNLDALEDLKNEGIEAIKNAVTKTKAKKAKSSYITKMNGVKTKLQQVREEVANYLETQNMTQEEKNKILEQVNNMSENDIEDLLKEYGYETQEEYVETNPNKLTVAILNDEKKFDEFIEKILKALESKDMDVYIDYSGDQRFVTKKTIKYMLYLLNYNYVDPDVSKADFLEYTERLAGVNPEGMTLDGMKKYTQMYDGILMYAIDYEQPVDYGLFIIENNEIKGIGDFIVKLEKSLLEKKWDKSEKLFLEYINEYAYKNPTIDRAVLTMIDYSEIELSEKAYNKKLELLYNNTVGRIEEQYFFSALDKKKVYKR